MQYLELARLAKTIQVHLKYPRGRPQGEEEVGDLRMEQEDAVVAGRGWKTKE